MITCHPKKISKLLLKGGLVQFCQQSNKNKVVVILGWDFRGVLSWEAPTSIEFERLQGIDSCNAENLFYFKYYIFIGPESDHCLPLSLTQSLTNWLLSHSYLVNLIDVTLACEDANSKLVNVVTVTDEGRVGNNLLQISKLRFGKKVKLLFRLWAQGLVKILKLRFRQDLKLEFGQFFFCWCFVEIMKLNLGQDSEARFG